MNTHSSYFEDMYHAATDPWHLETRWYEQRKYLLTMGSLPRSRYRAAFEPGCSVGVLTRLLAARCDQVLATDRVAAATQTAAERTRDLAHVQVAQLTMPDAWPEGQFDLIVLSELLYYFDDTSLHEVLRRTVGALEPDGTLVTVHWNHPAAEHTRTGPQLTPVLEETSGLQLLTDCRDSDFTLQVFQQQSSGDDAPPSPAQREGLT